MSETKKQEMHCLIMETNDLTGTKEEVITVMPKFARLTKLEFSKQFPEEWQEMKLLAFDILTKRFLKSSEESDYDFMFPCLDVIIQDESEMFAFSKKE